MKDIGSRKSGSRVEGPYRCGEIRQMKILFIHSRHSSRCFILSWSAFSALSRTRHPDKRQPSVDDGRRHGTHGMPVGKILSVLGRNVDFSIGEAVFHLQLFP